MPSKFCNFISTFKLKQIFSSFSSSNLCNKPKSISLKTICFDIFNKFDGLTVDSICNVLNKQTINKCIKSVGFHNRKTEYLFKTAHILKNEYDGDIPNTIKDLCKLPGIGPKMAYIAMQIAWNKNEGILVLMFMFIA